MNIGIDRENKVEDQRPNQARREFDWLEMSLVERLAGQGNENITLVSEQEHIRKGIKLNHNETLVCDDRSVG